MSTNTDQEIDLSILEEIASAPHCAAQHEYDNGESMDMPCSHTPVAIYSRCPDMRFKVCLNFCIETQDHLSWIGDMVCLECGRLNEECTTITPL